MLQIGVSGTALQRELGAIKNPTLLAFNHKIEGYEQARKATASTAYGNTASKGASQRRPSEGGPPKSNSHSAAPHGRGERNQAPHFFVRRCRPQSVLGAQGRHSSPELAWNCPRLGARPFQALGIEPPIPPYKRSLMTALAGDRYLWSSDQFKH